MASVDPYREFHAVETMGLVIRASSFLDSRYLKVTPEGVLFRDNEFFHPRKRFVFRQIDCVVMSADSVLSFQVGNEVFSIRTKPSNRKHQEVIRALMGGVRRSTGMSSGTPAP
jgi:hypothetical protein